MDIGDKNSVSGYLSDGLISFKDAKKIAPSLNDLAQCYTYLTTLAKEKINIYNSKTSSDEGNFSRAIDKFLIQPLNSNDIDEITDGLMIFASLTNDSKLAKQVNKKLEEQANNEERERLKLQYINALANYLSLTNDELTEKYEKQTLNGLLYRKLYPLQFDDYQTAKSCYTQLAKNSQISPYESSIMNTILETKW